MTRFRDHPSPSGHHLVTRSTGRRPASRLPLMPLVVCALACLAARPASAFRPFDGTDAHVAEPHLFELEMSPVSYARMGSVRSLIAPQVTLNYGTGSGFEFVLESASVMRMYDDPQGIPPQLQDAGFSMKKVLRQGVLQEKAGPSIATEAAVAFPSQGQTHAGYGASLIVSQPLSSMRTMLHLNAELAQTQELQTEGFLSMILEGPEAWPVRPVGELSWDRVGDETAEKSLLAGLIWQTRQGLAMDVAVKTLDGGADHGVEFRAGFTWHMQVHKGD